MNYAAEIIAVTKRFPGRIKAESFCAVEALSLQISENQIYGLLGLNGSGKSTTIKLLLDLLTPTEGECRLWGIPSGNPLSRAEIGYAPESPRFPPHMSGREVVVFYGKLGGLRGSKLAERVDRLLGESGLSEAADRGVAGYSKGMLQRLSLAQALVHDPRLLILDEPASGLDVEGVAHLTSRLRALKAEGKTILLTSHHFDQVGAVCDRIALLDRGRLVLEEDVSSLVSRSGWQQLALSGMDAVELGQLREWLASRGSRIESLSPATTRLEDVIMQRLDRQPNEKDAA